MGKISSNQQATEASATTPALPPQAMPLKDALDAMEVLQGRLTAAEARAATSALRIAPLATAFEDALASGAEADEAELVQLESEQRKARAEAAGLRRLIEAQRSVVGTTMAACQAARQVAVADAKKPLDGRLRAAASRLLLVLAEAAAFYQATGEVAEEMAIANVRLPRSLFDVPDPSLWLGVTGLQGDLAPVTNDATQQIEAMAAIIWQAQGVVGYE